MNTTDKDLLELSGKFAYIDKKLEIDSVIETESGNRFIVIDVAEGDETKNGLNAITVKNEATGEISIIYVGTDWDQPEDVATNIAIAGGNNPEQMEDAIIYYDKIKAINGSVDHVGGNSLGGAVANTVGIARAVDGIIVVTLNPAPTVKDFPYNKNGRNYVGISDVLTRLLKGMGMYDTRIPGEKIEFESGANSILASMISNNHTGYGERYSIHNMVPFSVWGDNIVLREGGGRGKRIKINAITMRRLSDALQKHIHEMQIIIQSELDPVYEIIKMEGNKIDNRTMDLNQQFETLFKTLSEGTIEGILDEAKTMVEKAQQDAKFFSFIGVDQLANIVNVQIPSILHKISKIYVPKLFEGVDNGFVDGFVEVLENHHETIDKNLHVMIKRWKYFADATSEIHLIFEEVDRGVVSLFNGAKSNVNVPTPQATWPNEGMEVSKHMEMVASAVSEKREMLETNFKKFSSNITQELEHLIFNAISSLGNIEHLLWVNSQNLAVKIENAEVNKNSLEMQKVWDEDLREYTAVDNTIELTQVKGDLETLYKEYGDSEGTRVMIKDTFLPIVKDAQNKIGPLLEQFKPEIKQALFNETSYGEIQQRCTFSCNGIGNLKLIFQDIEYNLQENEAEGITVLMDKAYSIHSGLQTLQDQLKIVSVG